MGRIWDFLRSVFFQKTDLKKSQICPIWGQSDAVWWQPDIRDWKLNILNSYHVSPALLSRYHRAVRCGFGLGQIGTMCDKSGTF